MYYFFVDLLSPFTLLLLISVLGVIFFWWKRVESRRRLLLVTIPLALLFFLCTPLVAYVASSTLEWPFPAISEVPDDSQAIVVLAGGILEPSETLPTAELKMDSRMRCIYAAELYKQRPLPILVAGGVVHEEMNLPPLSQEMKKLLIELGVPEDAIVVEDKSRSTYENATMSQPLLAERNIERIVLVTDADHMLRASECFTTQGFDVVPAACRHASDTFSWQPSAFLPRAGAAKSVRESMHEWLGIVWYKATGKI